MTIRSTQAANFVVSAKGTPAPTFQWRKGGVNIPGATSSTYLINAVQLSQAGTYDVVVRNIQGSVTSTAATLTVESSLLFASPTGVGTDAAGNLYIANSADHTICKVSPVGVVSVLAGAPGLSGAVDGVGGSARFTWPTSLAVTPSGTVYVGDGTNAIRVVSPAGVVTTLAGSLGQSGSADGIGNAARFGNLIQGIVVDGSGNLIVADTYNHTIRQVSPAGGVTTLAGVAGHAGATEGGLGTGLLNQPCGVALGGGGTLYIADYGNSSLRALTGGTLSTYAGLSGTPGGVDGTGASVRFTGPIGIVSDGAGKLYLTEVSNHTIRKIDAGAVVTTLAGSYATSGNLDGTGTSARFDRPTGITLTSAGNLVVTDAGNGTLRKVLLTTSEVTTYVAP